MRLPAYNGAYNALLLKGTSITPHQVIKTSRRNQAENIKSHPKLASCTYRSESRVWNCVRVHPILCVWMGHIPLYYHSSISHHPQKSTTHHHLNPATKLRPLATQKSSPSSSAMVFASSCSCCCRSLLFSPLSSSKGCGSWGNRIA